MDVRCTSQSQLNQIDADERIRVLIWVACATHFREMFRVARLLATQPNREPWMVFARWYAGVEQDLARLREHQISYVGYCPTSTLPEVYTAWDSSLEQTPAYPLDTTDHLEQVPTVSVDTASESSETPAVVPPRTPKQGGLRSSWTNSYFSFSFSRYILYAARRTQRVIGGLSALLVAFLLWPAIFQIKRLARRYLSWSTRNSIREQVARCKLYGPMMVHHPRQVVVCALRKIIGLAATIEVMRYLDWVTQRLTWGLLLPAKIGRGMVRIGRKVPLLCRVGVFLLRGLLTTRRVWALAYLRQLWHWRTFWREYLQARTYWNYRLAEVEDQLARIKPQLIILPEENVEYETSVLVKKGHAQGAKSLVLPFTIGNVREAAESYRTSNQHHMTGLYNQIFGKLYPQWIHHHQGIELLRLPAPQALAIQQLGYAPPKPWLPQSGFANIIGLESHALYEQAIASGLPVDRLHVCGAVRLDDLYMPLQEVRRRRKRLLNQLGLQDRRMLILCALPPDQDPASRPECEFTSYLQLAQFFVLTLTKYPRANVLVNPHPRCPAAIVSKLKRLGVNVVRRDIASLIPLCDLYVASVSATIPLALACGKPVINYDVYRYRYDDFDGATGVKTVFSRDAYIDATHQAVMGRFAPEPTTQWGMVDGRSGERILQLLDALLDKNSHSRPKWVSSLSAPERLNVRDRVEVMEVE